MMPRQIIFVVVLIAISPELLASMSEATSGTYKAAVVELAADNEPRPDNIYANVETIVTFIRRAKLEEAEIVIFPEMAVTGFEDLLPAMVFRVPDPDMKITPCDSNTTHKILKRLSCAARENKIYVVVNVAEMSDCTYAESSHCPESGWKIYNSNVVFDRSGTIISRYRKFHLFGETGKSVPDNLEFGIFETDFGVRFGMLVCFDLLFENPTLALVERLGITDIIHTVGWFQLLPFFSALQVQTSWAYSENITLLSAGFLRPEQGSTGSGIVLGTKGLVNYTISDNAESRMVTAVIPKRPLRPHHEMQDMEDPDPHTEATPFYSSLSKSEDPTEVMSDNGTLLVRHEDMSDLVTAPVESLNPLRPLCHGKFCCHFNVSIDTRGESTMYRAVVYRGVRPYFAIKATGGYQICGLVACANALLSSCGERISSNATVKHATISGVFTKVRSTITPSTLSASLAPLPVERYSFKKNCRHIDCSLQMSLHKTTQDLLTFAIFGRIFTMDGRPLPEPETT